MPRDGESATQRESGAPSEGGLFDPEAFYLLAAGAACAPAGM